MSEMSSYLFADFSFCLDDWFAVNLKLSCHFFSTVNFSLEDSPLLSTGNQVCVHNFHYICAELHKHLFQILIQTLKSTYVTVSEDRVGVNTKIKDN